MSKKSVAIDVSSFEVKRSHVYLKAQKGIRWQLFRELEFDDAALQPDHGSVGSVVGPQLREDASDSALDGFFRD
jgi:hypothetical protein